MKTNLIYRSLTLALAIIMMFGIVGCGGTTESTQAPAAAESKPAASEAAPAAPAEAKPIKDTLIVAFDGEPPTLSHQEHNSQIATYMNYLNYSGLFYIDENLEPQKDLCVDYRVENDTEWYFEIRKDVKFHNGEALTSADVVASLERAKTMPQVANFCKNFETIEAVDEYTVKITTAEPYALMLSDLGSQGNYIIPKSLIDAGNDFNQNPCGCGPYIFKEWVLGDRVIFEKNPDYYAPERAGNIQRIECVFIPEASARTIALETGDVDFVINIESMDLPALQTNPDVTLAQVSTVSLEWLIINNEHAPFDNINFRKALNAALDRQVVVAAGVGGIGAPQYAQVPMNYPNASDEGAVTYDVEAAKKYLEESGIDPASVNFNIVVSNDRRRRVAEVVQAQWAEIGINVGVEMMDQATYLTNTAQGQFDAAIGSFSNATFLGFVRNAFHKDGINAVNKSRLNDENVNALITAGLACVDAEAQAKAIGEISAAINETATQVPLYCEVLTRAYRTGLENVKVAKNGTIRICEFSWAEE